MYAMRLVRSIFKELGVRGTTKNSIKDDESFDQAKIINVEDYNNKEYVKKFNKLILKDIHSFRDKWEDLSNEKSGYFTICSLTLFSYYFVKTMLHNYLADSLAQSDRSPEIFIESQKFIFDEYFGEDFHKVQETLIRFCSRTQGFTDEVM